MKFALTSAPTEVAIKFLFNEDDINTIIVVYAGARGAWFPANTKIILETDVSTRFGTA